MNIIPTNGAHVEPRHASQNNRATDRNQNATPNSTEAIVLSASEPGVENRCQGGGAVDEAPKIEPLKPWVQLPGDGYPISDFATALGQALSQQGLFQRQGCAFTLDPEAQRFERVDPNLLRTWAEKHVLTYRDKQLGSGQSLSTKHTMNEDTARSVIVSPQFLEQLPKVERFNPCPMPCMRADGKIELLPIGLDVESLTYTADPGFEIKSMTLAEAKGKLDNILGEFPWPKDEGRSKAVQIAAMLTVFASGIMPPGSPKPVFLFVANAEGSGKTTLALLCGAPYKNISVEAAPSDDSEWQKKLVSVVIEDRKIILLDNVKGHLNSSSLEAYTTSTHFTGRILGASKHFTGETGATVLITGNGITITPDMRRRALFVELFMTELHAEDRVFQRTLDPVAIAQQRHDILNALWTLASEWDKAGRPIGAHQNSSFSRWCATIAGIVEFAGYGCPTVRADIDGMGDTDTTDLAKLVDQMKSVEVYEFSDMVSFAENAGLFEHILSGRNRDDELTASARSKMGKLLKTFNGRRVTEDTVFAVTGAGKNRRYQLKKGMVGMVDKVFHPRQENKVISQ